LPGVKAALSPPCSGWLQQPWSVAPCPSHSKCQEDTAFAVPPGAAARGASDAHGEPVASPVAAGALP